MKGLPLRKPTLLRHMNALVASVILVAAVAGALLVVPATANAHVDKSHKKAYSRTLKRWNKYDDDYWHSLGVLRGELNSIGAAEKPLIGSSDPTDQATLKMLEGEASAAAGEEKDVAVPERALQKEVAGFYKRAKNWFADRADRLRLKLATRKYGDGVKKSLEAGHKVASCAQRLGQADLASALDDDTAAVKLAKVGHGLTTAAMQELESLK